MSKTAECNVQRVAFAGQRALLAPRCFVLLVRGLRMRTDMASERGKCAQCKNDDHVDHLVKNRGVLQVWQEKGDDHVDHLAENTKVLERLGWRKAKVVMITLGKSLGCARSAVGCSKGNELPASRSENVEVLEVLAKNTGNFVDFDQKQVEVVEVLAENTRDFDGFGGQRLEVVEVLAMEAGERESGLKMQIGTWARLQACRVGKAVVRWSRFPWGLRAWFDDEPVGVAEFFWGVVWVDLAGHGSA
jgi:hypothetical protein